MNRSGTEGKCAVRKEGKSRDSIRKRDSREGSLSKPVSCGLVLRANVIVIVATLVCAPTVSHLGLSCVVMGDYKDYLSLQPRDHRQEHHCATGLATRVRRAGGLGAMTEDLSDGAGNPSRGHAALALGSAPVLPRPHISPPFNSIR